MIDTASLSAWLWIVAPVTVLLAYTILGLSGFGSTMVSIPILAHFLPLSYLVPVMALIDCILAASIGRGGRREMSSEEIKRILPYTLAGIVFGLTVLVHVPDAYLRIALGLFAAAVGIQGIVNPVLASTISRFWAIPAGLAGGAISTLFGAGGPIYATYFAGRLRDKTELRSTISTLIAISAFTRTVLYAVSGLVLHATTFLGLALIAPFAWLGLRLGTRIHLSLSQEQMRRAVSGLVLLAGLGLLARSL